MADTPALLPPDPSVPGRYWLRASNGVEVVGDFRCGSWRAIGQPTFYGARFMADRGYTLASPHPIPGPAALEALHYAIKLIRDRAAAERAADEGVDFFRGFACGMEHATGLLRQALETKEAT